MNLTAIVTIYKKCKENDVTNYRPMSILAQFSDILKKIHVSRLDRFVDDQSILNECKHCFQKKSSTFVNALQRFKDLFSQKRYNIYNIQIYVRIYIHTHLIIRYSSYIKYSA